MLITAKLRYAIMFMISLARKQAVRDVGKPVRMSSIAYDQDMPEGYLENIIVLLKKNNLVRSAKGPGGGYCLAVDSKNITLSKILNAIEEQIKITRCGDDDTSCLSNNDKCVAHDLWNDIERYLRKYFDQISVNDIVSCNLKFNNLQRNDKQYIYVDYNATAPMLDYVKEKIIQLVSSGVIYNPSAVHRLGQITKQHIEDVREKLRCELNISSSYDIVFTSSGTEANNLVTKGLRQYKHVISAIEHSSILNSAIDPIVIPVDKNGVVDLYELTNVLEKLHGSDVLVSIMMANNETGVIQPIKEIVRISHKFGALVHTDAVQACGKMIVDVEDLQVDLLTISSHKIGGISGSAALIVKKEIILDSLIDGGKQENGKRGGTEGVVPIIAFGYALEVIADTIKKMNELRIMRDYFEQRIKALVSDSIIFGDQVERLPNTTYVYMPGVSNYVQLMSFDMKGITVSIGAACALGKVDVSHVLSAMGVSDEQNKCSIRISLSPGITKNDISKIVDSWYSLYQNNVLLNNEAEHKCNI